MFSLDFKLITYLHSQAQRNKIEAILNSALSGKPRDASDEEEEISEDEDEVEDEDEDEEGETEEADDTEDCEYISNKLYSVELSRLNLRV